MKVIWLNDSLVLRSDNPDERRALATIYEALEPKEPAQKPTDEEPNITSLSVS